MAKKVNLSAAKSGMNKDTHVSNLKESEYTHALNINIENESGGFLNLQNEPSNLLAVNFPDGFKVINTTNDLETGDTYFMLTNPATKVGEFGIVRSNENIVNIEDAIINCPDCNQIANLADPLESTDQTPFQEYETLISDECHVLNGEPEKGFMFEIGHPIKKTVIKNEKLGKTIYFDQVGNPPRYINIDNLKKYRTLEVPCGDDVDLCLEDEYPYCCFNFDKMRVFQLHSIPKLTPVSIELGGNLKLGVYEFLISYCDASGNEVSEYFSVTNPISIFDSNNNILAQENLADRTNYAIKLHVDFLDKKFLYYKVAVIQTASLEGVSRYFVEGIHTTNDTTIIYTTEQNKIETSIDTLTQVTTKVEEAELVSTANGILYHSGVTVKKTVNLQPVVNLMGEFLKWQTHIAPEDLYENGVNTSLFVGYPRDEVVPFGIRFLIEGGIETPIFPFVGRTPKEEDLEYVVEVDEEGNPIYDEDGNFIAVDDNKDVQSIIENVKDCNSVARTKNWQYYNTATVEDDFCGSQKSVPVQETVETICEVELEDAIIETPGTITLDVLEGYTDLVTYINDHKDECDAFLNTEICDALEETYPENCTPKSIEIIGTGGSAEIIINGKQYIITFALSLEDTVTSFIAANGADITSYTNGSVLTQDENKIIFSVVSPTTDVNNLVGDLDGLVEEIFTSNCSSIVFSDSEVLASEVEGEEVIINYKIFGDEYQNMQPPVNDRVFLLDSNGDPIHDTDFEADFLTTGFAPPETAYKRNSTFLNELCTNAANITEGSAAIENVNQAYFNNYNGTTGTIDNLYYLKPDLVTTVDISATNANFQPKLHRHALWFKGKTQGRESFILDISQQRYNIEEDYFSSVSQNVRMSLFSSCSDTSDIFSIILNIDAGAKFLLKKSGADLLIINDSGVTISTIVGGWFTSGEFLLTIDNRIETVASGFIITPAKGTYTVTTRSEEVDSITVEYTSISFKKVSTVTAVCTFMQPVVESCTAVPYKKGGFAYWQSEETYPNNKELYDSSSLIIRSTDFPTNEMKNTFEDAFVDFEGIDFIYEWKSSEKIEGDEESVAEVTDFTCRNIRHFKFPDNAKAPFMVDTKQLGGNNSIIYPLGVTIDEEVINIFLDIAVNNSLITQADRDKITAYEIVRGDLNLNRSVIASGLLYDMRKYQEKGKEVDVVNNNYTLYPNYPFNSMRADIFNRRGETPDVSELFNDTTFGISNTNYTFHSPETDYNRPTLPSEMSIQGYMYGQCTTQYNEVLEHPKWVILSEQARALASTLALLETLAEVAIKSAEAGTNFYFGFTGNPVGAALSAVAIATIIAEEITRYGKYRYEWLRIFRDLGTPYNFAYYSFAVGKYNYMQLQQNDGERLRGINLGKYLKEGRFKTTNEVTGAKLDINNLDREQSVLLSTGEFELTYPNSYKNFDKTPNNASLTYMGEQGLKEAGLSSEVKGNIASPYAHLKNYLPSQHGNIDSIGWLTTGYRGDLLNPRTDCLSIFGGDTFISRHTLKRKHSQFLTTSMGQADLTPYNYYFYNNIGRNPKFFVSYNTDIDFESGFKNQLYPDITDVYNMDTLTKNSSYIRPPSKFYLYYYGIPSFLCETRINTNFRYAERTPERGFYPQTGDVGTWTQESNVSIRQPNYFFYNNTYSKKVTPIKLNTLPATFNREESDKRNDLPNGIIASLPDNSENSTYDPWLVYRPLDVFEFPTSYGKLKDLVGLENEAIYARFENTSVLYNKVDYTNDDGQAPNKAFLGGTSTFQRRSASFVNSEIGFGGTQNTQSISCEYGHFHVDAKRGQVIQTAAGGQGTEEISSIIGGKPSGMRNWFKNHLPFKILKHIKNADVDNNYNGVGLSMGYDSRFRRVFITKKDYIPLDTCIKFDEELGYFINDTECSEVPQIPTCPIGYTMVDDICQKTIETPLCPDGYEYNISTENCEKTEGLDIVFIVDTTAGNTGVIDELQDNFMTTVLPSITAEVGTNYRLALITVPDVRETGELFSVKVPFAQTNATTFNSALGSLVTSGDVGEPSNHEEALKAALDNLTSYNAELVPVGSISIGEFIPSNRKVIVLATPQLPGGIDPGSVADYDWDDWLEVEALANQAASDGIVIHSSLTASVEGVSTPPSDPTPPSLRYVMENYATVTGGSYSFNPLGVDLCNDISTTIGDIDYVTVIDNNCDGCVNTDEFCECIVTTDTIYIDAITLVEVTDPERFQDVSFTIAFSPVTGSWISYYDFKPNYYSNKNSHFLTGINGAESSTLWGHLLTNRSYGVFYGEKFPMEIEYPIGKNSFTNRVLNSVSIQSEAKHYSNEYDWVSTPNITFNRSLIYNNTNNSGWLDLNIQRNNFVGNKDYPKTNTDGTQSILITNSNDVEYSYNYFFNRIVNPVSNIPHINYDVNQLNLSVNNSVVRFGGKKVLEKINGDWMSNRIVFDKDSRYQLTLKVALSTEDIEQ